MVKANKEEQQGLQKGAREKPASQASNPWKDSEIRGTLQGA